jgi:hypothetical protein
VAQDCILFSPSSISSPIASPRNRATEVSKASSPSLIDGLPPIVTRHHILNRTGIQDANLSGHDSRGSNFRNLATLITCSLSRMQTLLRRVSSRLISRILQNERPDPCHSERCPAHCSNHTRAKDRSNPVANALRSAKSSGLRSCLRALIISMRKPGIKAISFNLAFFS